MVFFFSLKIKFKSEDVCLFPFAILCILDHVSKSTQSAVFSGEILRVGIKGFTDAGKDILAKLLQKWNGCFENRPLPATHVHYFGTFFVFLYSLF